MRLDNEKYAAIRLTKGLINAKMKVLADFDICSKDNESMRNKLMHAITSNPNKDPRVVLDCYCRPLIQAKINSWN